MPRRKPIAELPTDALPLGLSIVDGLEGALARIELPGGDTRDVPLSRLPVGVRDGDVLRVEASGTVIDGTETWRRQDSAQSQLDFLDVGQGDAVLITSPEGKSLLYDGGRSENCMRELIEEYGVKSVALVAASHADSDHITGLVPVIEQFRPALFLNNGLAGTTGIWQKLTRTVA